MRLSVVVIVVLVLGFLSPRAAAQNTTTISPRPAAQNTTTNWVHITQLRAGLVEDAMAVYTTEGLPVSVNPGGCPKTDAGYTTKPSDPGHKLFQTVLLSAYLNGKQVQIAVHGCWYSKPRIIGVFIKD